jgi:DNA-binding transcriptional MocR family regulator
MQTRPRTVPSTPIAVAIVRGTQRPLVAQIREQIRDLIASGDLATGMRLPPVRDLARQLEINQMTVAKAYKDLGAAGFVEGRRGGGTFVRAPNGAPSKRSRRGAEGIVNPPLLSERLFDLAHAPGVIAFTGNYPRSTSQCMAEWRTCLAEVMQRDLASLFEYDPPTGRMELRLRAAEFLLDQQVVAATDDIIVTSGAQQAIDLVLRSLVRAGDPVVVERPAYYGAINAMRSVGARILEVAVQPDGIDLDVLETQLSRHRPKLIYTNPTFQNPTGVTTSLAKRHAILALARRFGAAILEDDHSPELRFAGDPVPPIRALAEPDDAVFYARGFGKVFLPGTRLGVVVVPERYRKVVLAAKAHSDLHCNGMLQEALALYLARKRYTGFLASMRRTYAAHQRRLCEGLRNGLPEDTVVAAPEGGLSLWLTLPEGSNVSELYFQAVRLGVAFVAGEVFYAARPDPRTLRLSFGHTPPELLEEGMSRLCSVINDLARPRSASPMVVI